MKIFDMARTVDLITTVNKITKHFSELYINQKFHSYTKDLEGTFGINMDVVKRATSREIMSCLRVYGKREAEKSIGKFFLDKKDKEILYNRLAHHYPILKN